MSPDVNTGAHQDPLRQGDSDGNQAGAAGPSYAIVVPLNEAGIPQVLRDQPMWVAWQVMAPEKPGKKPRKVPINPVGRGKADSTDPTTWGSFEMAIACMRRRKLAGIGFVFSGTGFVGIDLDKCRDPVTGILESWAQKIVERLATYTEVSPTGMGLHLIARGVLPPEGRRRGNIEMYEVARFFTITGVRVEGTPADIEERTEQIAALHQEVFAHSEAPSVQPVPTVHTTSPARLTDEVILTRARAAKNRDKFDRLWAGDKTGYDSQSDADLALCGILAFWTNGDAEQLDRLFRRSGLMREKWDQKRGERSYGARTIDKALTSSQRYQSSRRAPEESGGVDSVADGRPQILVIPGQLPRQVEQAQGVLLAQPQPLIFQRDRILARLVRLLDASDEEGVRRPAGAIVIQPVEHAYLVYLLTLFAEWCLVRGKKRPRIDAPKKVVETLLASCGHWKLPHLSGVIEAPTLRRDGTLLQTQGYDPKTGLYLDYVGPEIAGIQDHPTREDGLSALAQIERIFRDFPFVEECDRSVVVAAVLTALVRRTLRTAPMFLFRAPTRGSGKSLLADIVSLVATGRSCAVMTAGQDATEERKQLFAILIQGDLIACIDNVERPLASSELCAMLTQSLYEGRLLGHSKILRVPTNVLWMATGNNLLVEGDLVSRVLTCDLDAKCEAPETREFEGDLRQRVLGQRAELIHAGLTILKAFHSAGSPRRGLSTFGRFEEWSNRVRAAVVWLGRPDPLDTAKRLRLQDPATAKLRSLLHAWHRFAHASPKTISDLMRHANTEREGELYEALAEIGGLAGGSLDSKAVGIFARMYAGRIIDGLSLHREGTTHGSARWSVRTAGGDGGDLSAPLRESNAEDVSSARASARVSDVRGEVPPVHPEATNPHSESGDSEGRRASGDGPRGQVG